MDHYICKGGCQAVSDTAGVCQDPSCPHFGHPLKECGCMDNKHGGAFDPPAGGEEKDESFEGAEETPQENK